MLGLLGNMKSFLKRTGRYRRYAVNRAFDINIFGQIFIEPCFNLCTLRCPYCPVGQGLKLRDMSRGMLPLDLFTQIWTKSFQQYCGRIALYNWGEPFLNPDLPGIVKHIKENSPARLLLNSHFSLSCDDRITEILKHLNNDTIVVSCDGFSQETCEKYRVNVDFDLVMHNVELLNGKKRPQTQLQWQYLKFPWNLNEVEAAQAFCREKRIPFYSGYGGYTPSYPILPTPRVRNRGSFRCDLFFDALTINFDGEVYPCCAYYGPPGFSLGNASENSIAEIFSRGRGKEMLDYLMLKSGGNDGVFCKHCVERNAGVLESWKQ